MEIVEVNLKILNLVIIAIYLGTLFFLFEVRSRVRERMRLTFTYLIIAVFMLILVRIVDLSQSQNLFFIPNLQEILVLILSAFIFMSVLHFYRFITSPKSKEKPEKETKKIGAYYKKPESKKSSKGKKSKKSKKSKKKKKK